MQLDGTNDHVTATRTATPDFSIELWFRSSQGIGTDSSWALGAPLVTADLSGTANDYGLSLRSDGRIAAGLGATSILSTVSGLDDGSWHHVVLTRVRTGGALTLYVDGATAATGTGGTQNLNGSTAVSLGRSLSGTVYLQGALDEVAFYSVALTSATVSSHQATGITP